LAHYSLKVQPQPVMLGSGFGLKATILALSLPHLFHCSYSCWRSVFNCSIVFIILLRVLEDATYGTLNLTFLTK